MIAPVCLTCGQPLDLSGATQAVCTACGCRYPMTLGIPDLRDRSNAQGYEEDPADARIVALLVEQYERASYSELLDIRMRNATKYQQLQGHEIEYHLVHGSRGREMIAMFRARLEGAFGPVGRGAALDIGCGSGGSLIVLADQFDLLVGADPSLPELILARKALETACITNVQLVQAYGQRISYAENSFDYINALNVLEHVFDIDGVMAECRRLLKPGGVFAGDSRNRFDLFMKEPHVRLRWVGLLPRRWAPAYVHWRKGASYTDTYLLSYAELQRALHRHFGRGGRILFPGVVAYGAPAWVDPWLQRLERLPLLGAGALWVFPSHLALARKG